MQNLSKYIMWLFSTATFFFLLSCDKNNEPEAPIREIETEVISKVVLTFVSESKDTIIIEHNDIDGVGGIDPVIDDILLSKDETYTCNIAFYNALGADEINLTPEISTEKNHHLLCYETIVPININRLDNDNNGLPLGLRTQWEPQNVGQGKVTITLYHYRNVDPLAEPDVEQKNGDCYSSLIDIQLTFNLSMI